MKPKIKEIVLGHLAIDAINSTIKTEIEPGEVVFSIQAQRHAMRRHPNDFARCLPYVSSVVTGPLYVGDDLNNPGKIELVSRLPILDSGLLVAVTLKRDNAGRYHVASFYPVSQSKIDNRRRAGTLLNVR